MEDEMGAVRAPPAATAAAAEAVGRRQWFAVELRPEETTIVSWKKLLREAGTGGRLSAAPPAAVADPGIEAAQAVPISAVPPADGELKDAVPPSNRFSAVIEKIERLYTGKESSDEEELDDVPDDDQYDTEDSFIDDTELDEYFQVDKLETKHTGYFVNRGKLEHIEPSSSPGVAQKKRRRKDSAKGYGETGGGHIPNEPVNMGNVRIKAAARNAPSMGKKLLSPSKIPIFGDHYQEGKLVTSKVNSMLTYKKKAADLTVNLENASSVKIPSKDAFSLPMESKDIDKQKTGGITSGDLVHKARVTSESSDTMYQASRAKSISAQAESHSKRLSHMESDIEVSNKIRHKERNGLTEFPVMNSSIYPTQALHPSTTRQKEGSVVRPKGTTLERAIRDLEKIVAECRPPDLDVQEADNSSQVVKRRLPQEVKMKLAKVARLSANQCKISEDDIIDRLMGILGHLVQRKTLKRNMKEMVELGLSAKQQKADRFQQIKKEVNEMIRVRVSHLKSKVAEHQDGSADDFQEAPTNDEQRALIGKYSMDKALEDKICDLYDLYVEGMDEDKGPQSRKLYVELAELWPSGYMDNLGIKEGIYRSKERKKALYSQHKVRDEERIKRKRLASAMRAEDANQNGALRIGQERPAIDSSSHIISSGKIVSNQPLASSSRADPALPVNDYGHHHGLKHYDRARGRRIMVTEDGRILKKKMKRRPESELGEVHPHLLKLPSHGDQEKPKSQKHGDDTNVVQHQKPSLQLPGPQVNDQPS